MTLGFRKPRQRIPPWKGVRVERSALGEDLVQLITVALAHKDRVLVVHLAQDTAIETQDLLGDEDR